MPNPGFRPNAGVITLLLATVTSAALAGTATDVDDTTARVLATFALALLTAVATAARIRDAREQHASGKDRPGEKPPTGD